jgi:hypothetical protein
MDNLSLPPLTALKLVDLYQLVRDIKKLQKDPIFVKLNDYLSTGQVLEVKVDFIFQSTSNKIIMEEVHDLLIFIDSILADNPLIYPEFTAIITEKLIALKNLLIQIQDLSNTQNV